MNKTEQSFDGKGETRTFAHLWVATQQLFELAENEKKARSFGAGLKLMSSSAKADIEPTRGTGLGPNISRSIV